MTEAPSKELIKVLVVDDDADVHFLVRQLLNERNDLFQVETVSSLKEAFQSANSQKLDVVLLDLSLDGSQGLATFDHFREQVKDLPIVIFTSLDDESAALEAVNKGAQDYLVKGHVPPRMLTRVLLFAVERYRTHQKARNPRLLDAVTGLANEQGFAIFAEHFLRSAGRNTNGTTVFLFVLEQLNAIEKKYGLGEAHQALKITTEILRESFRASDIMARIGPDRFVVIPTTQSPFFSRAVTTRIQASQTYYNTRFNLYPIKLRRETVRFPDVDKLSIEKFLGKINEAFISYEPKLPAAAE